MRLLKDKILVKPIVDRKTASGIEIPITNEKICRGEVVAVFDGIKDISVGDKIIHNLAYDEISEEERIVDIADVYAVYEEGSN